MALIVSDSYAGLGAADPIEVNGIFGIGISRKDLDVDVGVAGVDQLEFSLDPRAIVAQVDEDCYNWVLEAQSSADDPNKKRYVGLTINQAGASPVPSDWEFRGLINADMSATGNDWQGPEFDTEPDPTWVWKISALSLEIADFLEAKLEDLVAEIVATDQEWIDTNCPDRLGWFHRHADADDYGHREGRYGNMGRLIDVLNKLLDQAVIGKPVSIQLLDVDLAVTPFSANFETLTTERPGGILGLGSKTVDFRYGKPSVFLDFGPGSTFEPPVGDNGEWPYQFRTTPVKDSLLLSDIYVTWRLLTPRDESRAISWLPNDTIGGLIYAVAYALGGWVKWEFVDNTTINCRILTRKDASTAETIFLADAESDEIDVAPNDSETGRMEFPASLYAAEGRESSYYYDGSYGPPQPWSGRRIQSATGEEATTTEGPYVALSLSPTVGVLWEKSWDADVDFHEDYLVAPMPHNGIFYNDVNNREKPGFPGADLTDVHTAMYIGFTAPGDDPCIGCAGKFVVRPIGELQFDYYNAKRDVTIRVGVVAISTFLTLLRRVDTAAYKVERRIKVPYLTRFRLDPTGVDDWRYCKPGQKIPFDGVEYLIAGIERDFEHGTTTLRLHSTSRVSFAESLGATSAAEQPSSSITALERPTGPTFGRAAYPAGSAITAFAAVIADPSGRVHEAPADGWSYGRVLGVALQAAAAGERVEIATGGIITLPADYFSAGDLIYLRTPGSAEAQVANLSNKPIRYPTETETLHQVVATAMSTRRIRIEIDRPVFLKEDVVVPDFTTWEEVFT